MTSDEKQMPKIYLNDGVANSDLSGCTIVFPPHELTPHISLHECHDLDHLVRWALSHGYGLRDSHISKNTIEPIP
jgi:hypothetical protein